MAPNSPELLLLKFLPLTYYHSHFLAATLDFTSFFHHSLFEGRTLFLKLGCFVIFIVSWLIVYTSRKKDQENLIEQSLTLIQQSGQTNNYTLMKQPTLEHNLDIIFSIIS